MMLIELRVSPGDWTIFISGIGFGHATIFFAALALSYHATRWLNAYVHFRIVSLSSPERTNLPTRSMNRRRWSSAVIALKCALM